MKRKFDNIALMIARAAVALAIVFMLAPLVMSAIMSFDARTYLGSFPPPDLSLRWYKEFFNTDIFVRGLRVSLVLALISATISTVAGASAALALDRYQFPGKELLTALFLSPLIMPGVVLGFGLLLFFAHLGVFDGFYRLVGGHIIITMPYTIRTTLASLVGIEKRYLEAALSLGANERQAFWEITFPLARTGIAAGAVFAFAISMDDVAASVFLTDPHSVNLPVAMVSMMRSAFDLSIAAGAVMLVGLTTMLIVVLDRLVGLDRIIGQGIYRN